MDGYCAAGKKHRFPYQERLITGIPSVNSAPSTVLRGARPRADRTGDDPVEEGNAAFYVRELLGVCDDCEEAGRILGRILRCPDCSRQTTCFFRERMDIRAFLTAGSTSRHQHPDCSPVMKPGTLPSHRGGRDQGSSASPAVEERHRKATVLHSPA
jgi:hypothetical protein